MFLTMNFFLRFNKFVIQKTNVIYFRTKSGKNYVESGKDINSSLINYQSNKPSYKDIIKPLGFFISVTGLSVAGCAIWQYENMKEYSNYMYNKTHAFKYGILRQKIYNYWNNDLDTSHKLVAVLIGLNALIFVMWQIPQFQSFLLKYFASHPKSKSPCLSMLFSIFSHCSLWHLTFNMVALWSFAPAAISILGKEQFLAFYVTSGTFASLASYMLKIVTLSSTVSIGASGALMAIVGLVCAHFPDTRLSIIFLPWFSFSGLTALKALFVFDSLGVILRWQLFDHAAHLGGLLFGLWYVRYGDEYIWSKRDIILSKWHEFRKRRS